MMAAAVCLGEEFSPKRLFSLGSGLVASCLSQRKWRSDIPGSKYVWFLPAPTHISSSHSSELQNLNWAGLQKPPRGHLCCHPDAHPSLAVWAVAGLVPMHSSNQPARQRPNSPAKQGAPRRQQINEMCPQICSTHGIAPSSQEADDLPMHLLAQWSLQVASLLAALRSTSHLWFHIDKKIVLAQDFVLMILVLFSKCGSLLKSVMFLLKAEQIP